MHKHTVDWLRQVSLTADIALAEKRWRAAEAVANTLGRPRLIELLRLFLFPPVDSAFATSWTDDLIAIDPEFPVSQNIQELRLMAGLVMTVTFEGAESDDADAFALGLRAAQFPNTRVKAIQPAILGEAEEYLRKRAGRLRPNSFALDNTNEITKLLVARGKRFGEAEASGDEAKKTAAHSAYRDAVPQAIALSYQDLAKRVQQLAEESALLWWVLTEYSESLQQPADQLTPEEYALPAAAEAAERTIQLPPPPSIGPLLARALRPCGDKAKKLVLADYVKATSLDWRASYVRSINVADCGDLTPLSTALAKTEELGNFANALRAVAKLCPGLKRDLALAPSQAAHQLYNEVLFLRALDATAD